MSSILKVNQIQDIGGNTIVSSDGTGGFTSNLPTQAQNAFRNIIINGDMSIAQRGTSTASISSGATYHTVDRWKTRLVNLGTWTQSQSTDVPSGQGFTTSLKMDCTTADTDAGTDGDLRIFSGFEGQNLQYLKKGTASATSLTASFWVKSSKTGTYILELFDGDNSRQISKSYTINSADTWEKKTITFAGDTTDALDNDNNASLFLIFWLGAGTDFTSGTLNTSWNSNTNANRAVGQVNLADNTANEWYITGVQLEAGTTASDFEFLPYDVNYQRCIRYCNALLNYGVGSADDNRIYNADYANSNGMARVGYPRMRINPSISYTISNGTISNNFSSNGLLQLMDNGDNNFFIYDILLEAEL